MIDPLVQFGNAGADDEHTAQALADARARLDAICEAWRQFCAAAQEAVTAIAEIAREFIVSVGEAFKPVATAIRRRVLYARLSEHLPGWLARPLVAVWPRRFLPALRW